MDRKTKQIIIIGLAYSKLCICSNPCSAAGCGIQADYAVFYRTALVNTAVHYVQPPAPPSDKEP